MQILYSCCNKLVFSKSPWLLSSWTLPQYAKDLLRRFSLHFLHGLLGIFIWDRHRLQAFYVWENTKFLFFSWWKGKINCKDSWNAFQSGSHFTAVLCLSVRLKLNFLYTFYSHRKSGGVSLCVQLESLTLWGMGLRLGKMRKQTCWDSLFCHWEASNGWECRFFSGKWGG